MPYHVDIFESVGDSSNRAALESTPNYEYCMYCILELRGGIHDFSVTFSATDAFAWHEYRQAFLPYRIPGYITPVMTLPQGPRGESAGGDSFCDFAQRYVYS